MKKTKEVFIPNERVRLADVDTYVFDYGGVVSFHYCEPWQGNIAKLLGVDSKSADRLLSETSPQGKAYREGRMTRDDFWSEVKRLAGATNASSSDLEQNWSRSYQIDERMVDLIERLRRERRFKTGIIMNTDEYRYKHIEDEYGLSMKVDFIIPSFKTGFTKPDPRVYRLALSSANRLRAPGRVVYVDDKPKNVDPCARLGIKGMVFTTYENFATTMSREGVIHL